MSWSSASPTADDPPQCITQNSAGAAGLLKMLPGCLLAEKKLSPNTGCEEESPRRARQYHVSQVPLVAPGGLNSHRDANRCAPYTSTGPAPIPNEPGGTCQSSGSTSKGTLCPLTEQSVRRRWCLLCPVLTASPGWAPLAGAVMAGGRGSPGDVHGADPPRFPG